MLNTLVTRPLSLTVIVLALVQAPIFAPVCYAQWAQNGVRLSTSTFNYGGVPVADGRGGAFISLFDPLRSRGIVQSLSSDGRAGLGAGFGQDGFRPCIGPTDFAGNGVTSVCRNADGSATLTVEDSISWTTRLTPDGGVMPGWPRLAPIGNHFFEQSYVVPTSSGANLMFFPATPSGNILCSRLEVNGEPSVGQPDSGRVVVHVRRDTTLGLYQVQADPSGGAWLACYAGVGEYTQHAPIQSWITKVRDDGIVDSTWGNGRLVFAVPPAGPRAQVIAPDGTGGVFIAWMDDRSGATVPFPQFENYYDIYATRIDSHGHIAQGWPLTGLPICTSPGRQMWPKITADGTGGAFIIWEPSGGQGTDIHAQHVLADGTLAPGWPVDGKRMFSGFAGNVYDLAADGMGGLFVAALSRSDFHTDAVFAQHVNGHGDFDTNWSARGYNVDMTPLVDCDEPAITTAEPGSAIITWTRGNGSFVAGFAQKLTIGGVVATQLALTSSDAAPDHVSLAWTASGDRVGSATVERRAPSGTWIALATVEPDGEGRLCYTDRAITPGARYDYRLSWLAGNVTVHSQESTILVPLPYRFALAGARPNPATRRDLSVAFTLAEAGPATLELYDVNGRRVAEHAVGALGLGEHSLRMGDTLGLSAGIYWLRLTQGAKQATARVAVVE
jgi:hypothetical protein